MAVSRDFIPITAGDLKLGEPAPFDCYGESKTLMLKAGTVVVNMHLEKLVGVGYKIDDTEPEVVSDKTPFETLDELKNRLQKIFVDFHEQVPPATLQGRVVKLCQDIQKLCEMDSCATLGAIHLNYGGRHTINHPIHVAIICELIAQAKEVPPVQRVSLLAAAITCNIGMLKLQDVLNKQDVSPTKEQKDTIRSHPFRSVVMLMKCGVKDGTWLRTVKHHHEKLNGKGYPGELSGDDIPLPVRILSLADIYCSLVSSRSYRSPVLAQEALRIILLKRSKEIDVPLAQLMIKSIGIYPPGTFVQLQNAEKALVIRRSENAAAPIVKSFAAPSSTYYKPPVQRDCSDKAYAIKEMIPRDKEFSLNFEMLWDYGR